MPSAMAAIIQPVARAGPMRSTWRLSSRLPITPKAPNQKKNRLTASGLAPRTCRSQGAMYAKGVNCPAENSAVTATMAISTGWVKTLRQLARDRAGGRTPSGITRQTTAMPASDSPATRP